VDQAQQTVLSLHAAGAYWKLSGSLARLKEGLAELSLRPAGPLIGLFLDDPNVTPAEQCRYVLAYPVDVAGSQPGSMTGVEPAAGPTDLIQPGTLRLEVLPAGPRAVLDYDGLAAASPQAYRRLEDWLESEHMRAEGPPEEVYLAEPGTLGRGLMKARIRRRVVPAE
jgi:DNA gyrase inhibitor GyrI